MCGKGKNEKENWVGRQCVQSPSDYWIVQAPSYLHETLRHRYANCCNFYFMVGEMKQKGMEVIFARAR